MESLTGLGSHFGVSQALSPKLYFDKVAREHRI